VSQLSLANSLAGPKEYTVTMRAGYDVLQGSGQIIEFGELRHISEKRPDRASNEQTAAETCCCSMTYYRPRCQQQCLRPGARAR
jgi:hypothetical protein